MQARASVDTLDGERGRDRIVSPTTALSSARTERARGDLEPLGELRPGPRRSRLEQRQEAKDAEYERMKDEVELVHAPKVMPWGNKTFQLRDPEGTAVSLYAPVTDEAKRRFASR